MKWLVCVLALLNVYCVAKDAPVEVAGVDATVAQDVVSTLPTIASFDVATVAQDTAPVTFEMVTDIGPFLGREMVLMMGPNVPGVDAKKVIKKVIKKVVKKVKTKRKEVQVEQKVLKVKLNKAKADVEKLRRMSPSELRKKIRQYRKNNEPFKPNF